MGGVWGFGPGCEGEEEGEGVGVGVCIVFSWCGMVWLVWCCLMLLVDVWQRERERERVSTPYVEVFQMPVCCGMLLTCLIVRCRKMDGLSLLPLTEQRRIFDDTRSTYLRPLHVHLEVLGLHCSGSFTAMTAH